MAAGGAEARIQFGISLVPATERLDRLREGARPTMPRSTSSVSRTIPTRGAFWTPGR
jgi:hypothetical protein